MIDGTKPHRFERSGQYRLSTPTCRWCSLGPDADMHFGYEDKETINTDHSYWRTHGHLYEKSSVSPCYCWRCGLNARDGIHQLEEEPTSMSMQPVRARIKAPTPAYVDFESLVQHDLFLNGQDVVCQKTGAKTWREVTESSFVFSHPVPIGAWMVRKCRITGIEVELS